MPAFITHIQLANSALCLVLAGHFLFAEAQRKLPSRLLGFTFLLSAVQSLLLVGTLNQWLGPLAMLRPTLAMLIGPAFYLFYRSVKQSQPALTRFDVLHLVPSLTVATLFFLDSPLLKYFGAILVASFLAYLLVIGRGIRHGHQSLAHLGSYAPVAFRWICILVTILLINLGLEIAIALELQNGKPLGQSYALAIACALFLLVFGFTVFAALRRHPLLEWLVSLGETVVYERTNSLDADQSRQIFSRWQTQLEEQELFKLEYGLTLSEAAKKLQIPSRQLSNAINKETGESFSRHLNRRRIDETKKLFSSQPDITITDAMYASGFSSKSNFNKEFSRVTGMTPSAFRGALLRE